MTPINERGLRRIASILRTWHKSGHEIARSRERLLAWADGLAAAVEGGRTPKFEIPARDCVRGYPMTFALSREHFTTEESHE